MENILQKPMLFQVQMVVWSAELANSLVQVRKLVALIKNALQANSRLILLLHLQMTAVLIALWVLTRYQV